MLALLAALGAAACGDNARLSGDGGMAGPDVLEALAPGPDVGLVFTATVELRVRLRDYQMNAVGGREVRFTIGNDPDRPADGPAGSILAAPSSLTDMAGIARVNLTAGRTQTRFLVTATAEGALPATFQVAVSAEGFAALEVRPRYTGVRAESLFALVRVHLYDNLTCGKLLAGAGPPPSFYPPRTSPRFGEPISYANLLPRMPYAVLARGEDAAGHARAQGCVDLTGGELPPGRMVVVPVPARDRRVLLEGEFVLETALDLRAMATTLGDAAAAWRVLAGCPDGPGQLLADALLAELPAGALRDALAARRGELGGAGAGACRGALAPAAVGGGASLEARATALLVETTGAPATRLGGIELELSALAERLELTSRVSARPLGEGRASVTHTLEVARLRLGAALHEVVLAPTARPQLVVDEVAIELMLGPVGETATVPAHGFSLRWGELLARALGELSLRPRSLPTSGPALAAAIVDQAGSGATRGCAALDAGLCTFAGQAAGCLAAVCLPARAAMGGRLSAGLSALDGAGADLTLTGATPVTDADGDARADALGTVTAPGLWTAKLTPAASSGIAITGSFMSR